MRILIPTLAALALAAPAFAGHEGGVPPGRAAMTGIDRNDDDRKNGKDYAPGQSAAAGDRRDVDGNLTINGRDYAPGQRR
jgi:hypothetical protein